MKKKIIFKFYFVILLIFFLSFTVYSFNYKDEILVFILDCINFFTNQNLIFRISFYLLIFIITATFSMPVILFTSILGGYLFGQTLGLILVIFSLIITFNVQIYLIEFFISKIKKNNVYIKYKEYFKKANNPIIISIIRMIPFMPFTLQNLIIFDLKFNIFNKNIFTIFGLIPISFVIVSFGNSLNDLSLEKINKISIYNNETIIYFILYIALIFLLRKIFRIYNSQ